MLRISACRFNARVIAKAIATFPVAVVLWPIVSHDYAQRQRGNRPDRWHWADRRLLQLGWYVSV